MTQLGEIHADPSEYDRWTIIRLSICRGSAMIPTITWKRSSNQEDLTVAWWHGTVLHCTDSKVRDSLPRGEYNWQRHVAKGGVSTVMPQDWKSCIVHQLARGYCWHWYHHDVCLKVGAGLVCLLSSSSHLSIGWLEHLASLIDCNPHLHCEGHEVIRLLDVEAFITIAQCNQQRHTVS